MDRKGKVVREVLNNDKLTQDLAQFEPTKKEFFTFTTSEGVSLNGWMIKPATTTSPRRATSS